MATDLIGYDQSHPLARVDFASLHPSTLRSDSRLPAYPPTRLPAYPLTRLPLNPPFAEGYGGQAAKSLNRYQPNR
jgi:hypothetical protein